MIYIVSMEKTRNGNPKQVKVEAADRFEAEATAEQKHRGFAAVDSREFVMTVDDLKVGTKFQFTKIAPGSYATPGIDYVVEGACKHNINWRRVMPDGSRGAGSGDSRSHLRSAAFIPVSA